MPENENINEEINNQESLVEYTDDNIRHLSDMEHVRTRPGMYIGRLGDGNLPEDGIYVLLKEVIDNSIDEFKMKAGDRIEVDNFIKRFGHLFITKVLGANDNDEFINSTDTEYVMRRIRQKYLSKNAIRYLCVYLTQQVYEMYSVCKKDF